MTDPTNACKQALMEACRTDEPIDEVVERLFWEHGTMTREAMRVGLRYARGHYQKAAAKAAAEAEARGRRFKLAQTDDIACLQLLAERLPGIIERLKAEPVA